MNAEFHYYAIYFLCLRAGMGARRCSDIAFSSQYVDNAILAYDIEDGGFSYRSQATQNYSFWDEETLRGIYLPFHFIPGVPEAAARERLDGRASRWAVTPDSPLARELLVAALRSGSDFRIGIALHAYADTWAHQHFSGRVEQLNVIDPSSPLPAAGHLQALRAPDDAAGRWTDPRLLPELARVDNASRFRAAAKKVYRYLRTSLRLGFEEEDIVLDELASAWARYPLDMKARLASLSVDAGVPPYDKRGYLSRAGIVDERSEETGSSGYDKLDWLRSELARRSGAGSGIKRIQTGGRFRGSELHQWNEAAREHRELATSILSKEGLI
jgi:hypothetical protein